MVPQLMTIILLTTPLLFTAPGWIANTDADKTKRTTPAVEMELATTEQTLNLL